MRPSSSPRRKRSHMIEAGYPQLSSRYRLPQFGREVGRVGPRLLLKTPAAFKFPVGPAEGTWSRLSWAARSGNPWGATATASSLGRSCQPATAAENARPPPRSTATIGCSRSGSGTGRDCRDQPSRPPLKQHLGFIGRREVQPVAHKPGLEPGILERAASRSSLSLRRVLASTRARGLHRLIPLSNWTIDHRAPG